MDKVTITEDSMRQVVSMLNKINQADHKAIERLLSFGVVVSEATKHTECVIDDDDSGRPLLSALGIINGIMRTLNLPDIYQVWDDVDIAGIQVPTLIKFEMEENS